MENQNTYIIYTSILMTHNAFIAQSGERQTEDLVVAGSIPAEGIPFGYFSGILAHSSCPPKIRLWMTNVRH